LIWHEHKDKTPLAQAMVTGYQYEIEPESNQKTSNINQSNSMNQTQGDHHA
jgi:hypothetical protein